MFLFAFLQDLPIIPNITDWLQGIGTIFGVPGAIAAFILLFKKDKDKENKLGMLTNMVIELSNQTKQFEYQTSLMRESNEILRDQVEIQTEALLSDKDYKMMMKEIEIKKTKIQYKPYFIKGSATFSNIDFWIKIKNIGEMAKISELKIKDKDKLVLRNKIPTNIERNGSFELSGTYLDNDRNIEKQIDFVIEDSISTIYYQTLKIKGTSYELSELVENIPE